MTTTRERRDRCPGVRRPWLAEDGMLVRLRLIGGRVSASSLRALAEVADELGDGRVRVTSRANLQVRGLPGTDGVLTADATAALLATGLVPSPTHELVRNVMVSPQTGLAGGRADLRALATELDALLCCSEQLADLSARFLFVLDDGRGDLVDRVCDLGLVALDSDRAQLRIGEHWGEVVPLSVAAARIAALAERFVAQRGDGPEAPWHVRELARPLVETAYADPALPAPSGALPHGRVPGGDHVALPESGLDRRDVDALASRSDVLVVTPWRGVLVPDAGGARA